MVTSDRQLATATPNHVWWGGLVMFGLNFIRSHIKLSADESAAWDTVVGVIQGFLGM